MNQCHAPKIFLCRLLISFIFTQPLPCLLPLLTTFHFLQFYINGLIQYERFFLFGFFYSACSPIHLQCCRYQQSIPSHFNSALWYGCISLSTHRSVGMGVLKASSGLLQIKLPWTFLYKCTYEAHALTCYIILLLTYIYIYVYVYLA